MTAASRSRRGRWAVALAAVLAALAAFTIADCGSSGNTPPALLTTGEVTHVGPIAVSPQPDTPDASPTTQISFLGPPGTHVASITVIGSKTGRHHGRLAKYSTGTGESFLPRRAFAAGETVSVHAVVHEHGKHVRVETNFTVGEQVPYPEQSFPEEPGDPSAVQRYVTLPGSTPSSVKITVPARHGAASGLLLQAPYQGIGTAGPMISTQSGRLIWFHRLPRGLVATNLSAVRYDGKPVLVWWQGRILELGFGVGEDVIYDDHYRLVAHVRAGNGYHADLHSIVLTNQGTAWIDAFDPVREDLSAAGGESEGSVSDSVIQEIDVKTGLVMWEWHALGHIPLTESHSSPPSSFVASGPKDEEPWDYVHINSVDPLADGQVLLSARNTWALYDVQMRGGGIRWRLGGDSSNFAAGAGTHFYWQHDAELHENGLISVFDNGADPQMEPVSRAILLRANPRTRTVHLEKAFIDPNRALLATSQGNMQALAHGGWMVGYGGLPNFVEFSRHGKVLLEGTLGRGVQSFRTFLQQWSATPETPPALVVRRTAAGAVAYMSWNGATAVARWRVLGVDAKGHRRTLADVPASGFETKVVLASPTPSVSVQALGMRGSLLGQSAVQRG